MMLLLKLACIVLAALIDCHFYATSTRAQETAKSCACDQLEAGELVDSVFVQPHRDASQGGALANTATLILSRRVTTVDLICASANYEPTKKLEVATGLAVAQVKLGRASNQEVFPNQTAGEAAQSILRIVKNCADKPFIRAFRKRVVEERYDGSWGKDKGGDCRAPPCTAG